MIAQPRSKDPNDDETGLCTVSGELSPKVQKENIEESATTMHGSSKTKESSPEPSSKSKDPSAREDAASRRKAVQAIMKDSSLTREEKQKRIKNIMSPAQAVEAMMKDSSLTPTEQRKGIKISMPAESTVAVETEHLTRNENIFPSAAVAKEGSGEIEKSKKDNVVSVAPDSETAVKRISNVEKGEKGVEKSEKGAEKSEKGVEKSEKGVEKSEEGVEKSKEGVEKSEKARICAEDASDELEARLQCKATVRNVAAGAPDSAAGSGGEEKQEEEDGSEEVAVASTAAADRRAPGAYAVEGGGGDAVDEMMAIKSDEAAISSVLQTSAPGAYDVQEAAPYRGRRGRRARRKRTQREAAREGGGASATGAATTTSEQNPVEKSVPVIDAEATVDQLPLKPQDIDENQKGSWEGNKSRLYLVLAIALTVLAVAVVVPVVVLAGGDDKDDKSAPGETVPEVETPSEAPTSRPFVTEDHPVYKAVLSVSKEEDLSDRSSPQYKALDWIVYDDMLGLDDTSPNLAQRYALMVLYFATKGKTWQTPNNSFYADESLHECDWFSVDCTVSEVSNEGGALRGRALSKPEEVTGLMLERRGLSGSLPPEIGELDRLEILDLRENSLSGSSN